VIASPGHTAIVGLETPVASPTPSASARAVTRSEGVVTAPRPKPTAQTTSLAQARTKLTRIATLNQPLGFSIRVGDTAFYIAERVGTIHAIRSGNVDPTPVLDITTQVTTSGQEQGLLGLAFSPDGSHLYVNFTNTQGDTVIRAYRMSNGRAVTTGSRDILTVDQPFANHNGGNLLFGPDGYLYVGLGDGGGAGDPAGNAQNLNSLLGKMLRIKPTPDGSSSYDVPPDNPFVGRAGARGEIWAYGYRNPWRYSFDSATKDMWIGDVGQNSWEEIDFQSGSSKGGDNYGWSFMEGTHTFKGTAPANHHGPTYEYSHDGGNCSVTGGYVYRGTRIKNLPGAYLFADYCVGRLRAFVVRKGRASDQRFLGPQTTQLSSFGEDGNGELYVTSLDGGVFRLDPA
jgi:glucose/arabinose dehydrogenase